MHADCCRPIPTWHVTRHVAIAGASMGGWLPTQQEGNDVWVTHPTIHYTSAMPIKARYVQVCHRTQMPWCYL